MQLTFNELSVSHDEISEIDAREIMTKFLANYTLLHRIFPDFSRKIITSTSFNNVELAPRFYLAQWRNLKTVDPDEKRKFLELCEHEELIATNDEDFFIQYGNHAGKGFLIAYENQYPTISFLTSDVWRQSFLQCELFDVEEGEKDVTIVNISDENTIEENQDWICQRIEEDRIAIKNASEFLDNYESVFSALVFHKTALTQMRTQIQNINVPTIVEKLYKLEAYFSKWDGGTFDKAAFPRRFVSPESEATLSRYKQEHTFEWNGSGILVSWHVRYTGGNNPRPNLFLS